MRVVASVCLLLAACGPVLLVDGEPSKDPTAPSMGGLGSATAGSGAGAGGTASSAVGEPPDPADEAAPSALITVKPVDCGRCFDLTASGSGGFAPYVFEWEDGSGNAQRRVCPQGTLEVSVIAQGTNAVRSAPYVTRLVGDASAMCAPPPSAAPQICITNPSFDGVAAYNMGDSFDAPPWSACSDDPAVPNTPDIGSVEVAQTEVPAPTEGDTYLGLGIGEQASQQLCETMQAGTDLSFEIDLSRVNVTTGVVPPTGNVFLEILGGVAADCEPRRLLWASPPLEVGWKRHCVELHPAEFMDRITLRASSDDATLTFAYVLADHLVPVASCP